MAGGKGGPAGRLLLPEFEFNIEIPDEVISDIDIEELRAVISTEKTQSLAKRVKPVAA